MKNTIETLVETQLTDYFGNGPSSPARVSLYDTVRQTLINAAQTKAAEGLSPAEAVEAAFDEMPMLSSLIANTDADQSETASQTTDEGKTAHHAHHIDIDEDGIRVDDGKTMRVDNNGITLNEGRTLRADANGLKIGDHVFGVDPTDPLSEASWRDGDDFEMLPPNQDTHFDSTSLKTIDIMATHTTLSVFPTDGDEVLIRERITGSNDDYRARTRVAGDTLQIMQGTIPHFFRLRVYLDILIPSNFKGQIKIRAHRSKLDLKSLTDLENLSLTVDSGAVRLNEITAATLAVQLTSGTISLAKTDVQTTLTLAEKSGIVNMIDVTSPVLNIVNDNGTFSGMGLHGAGSITGHAGTINAQFDQITGDWQVENGSGTIALTMPNTDYFFDLEAANGTVKGPKATQYEHNVLSLKEGTVGDHPEYRLTVRAKSGTINVR